MILFKNFIVADSKIYGLTLQNDMLVVNIKDWNGYCFGIMFTDVESFEFLGPLNTDLSHTEISVSSENYSCFSFVSAWEEKAILKIIAKEVNVFGI